MISYFKKFIFLFILFLFNLHLIKGQVVISNRGFEGNPSPGGYKLNLQNWIACSIVDFQYESVPDIHPNNFWGVDIFPSEGNTYIGMVTRDNETWESIGQLLKSPIRKGVCHEFSIDLCRSENYKSLSRLTKRPMNYTEPVVLRIWAGNNICEKKELLGESTAIEDVEWKTYSFEIKPSNNYNFIILEAYYSKEKVDPYCGHILIDNMSNITIKDCKEK